MLRISVVIAILCALAVGEPISRAGTLSIPGVSDIFWDRYAIIVAEVSKVDKEGDRRVIAVQTLAVIGTHNVVKSSMVVPYLGGLNGGTIGFNPEPGKRYVLFLELIQDRWWVTSDLVTFLGQGQTSWRLVKGVDDPQVDAIANRVAESYAEWRREHDAKKP